MSFFKWLFQKLNSELGQVGFDPFARPGQSFAKVNIEEELTKLLRSPFDPGLTEREKAGLETLRRAGDPTAQLAAARQRFERFTSPEVISRLTAAGFGRSGAVAPALARAFAPTAAQIESQARQNRVLFGQSQIAAGEAVSTRRASLLGRALKVLQQLQGLREAQAVVNAGGRRVSNITHFPRGLSQPSALPTIARATTATPVAPTQLPPVPEEAPAPVPRTSIFQGPGGRGFGIVAPGGSSIFRPTPGIQQQRDPNTGLLPPGTTLGGPEFGGTITVSPTGATGPGRLALRRRPFQ